MQMGDYCGCTCTGQKTLSQEVPLSVPEIRHLLALGLWPGWHGMEHLLHWTDWRRQHKFIAQLCRNRAASDIERELGFLTYYFDVWCSVSLLIYAGKGSSRQNRVFSASNIDPSQPIRLTYTQSSMWCALCGGYGMRLCLEHHA
jgi:hypothetical protein